MTQRKIAVASLSVFATLVFVVAACGGSDKVADSTMIPAPSPTASVVPSELMCRPAVTEAGSPVPGLVTLRSASPDSGCKVTVYTSLVARRHLVDSVIGEGGPVPVPPPPGASTCRAVVMAGGVAVPELVRMNPPGQTPGCRVTIYTTGVTARHGADSVIGEGGPVPVPPPGK